MKEQIVVYKDDDYDVEIAVRQVSYGEGTRRYALISREQARLKEREKKGDVADWGIQWAALRLLPACTCATVEIHNLPRERIKTLEVALDKATDDEAIEKIHAKIEKLKGMKELQQEMDLDEFLALPEALVIHWEQAVYGCNPHWLPVPKEDKSGEAQEPSDNSTSTKGSSSGSKTKKQKTSQNGTSTT